MSPVVHLLDSPKPREIALLHRLLGGVVEVHCGPRLHEPASFEVLVSGRPSREHLQASPKLRAVVIPFAGIPKATCELLREFPQLSVHNLHHNAAATAEMALTLLLAASKRLVPADRALREGDWMVRYGDKEQAVQLAGNTALVLGLGAIGARVARALRALGMTVLGVRRDPSAAGQAERGADEVHGPDALRVLIPRARAVVVCVPATEGTEGLLGREELALLDPQAILVNVARGPVIDERALYEALLAERFFGAGLDVWWRYPENEAARASTPPSALPFGELDNVVLSPHRGGHVQSTEPARMEGIAKLLQAYARGEPMPNRVDLDAGY